jgi:hypothetical protein
MQLELPPYPRIARWLEDHAAGTSEYELIRWLKEQNISLNGHSQWDLSEPLSLYHSHFEVMHALYQLRDRWRAEQKWMLHLTPMTIWLTPCVGKASTAASHQLSRGDKLRDFYLNRDNLEHVKAESVADLLQQFLRQAEAACHVQDAITTLGFAAHEQPGWPAIRQRYRRLQAKHHPDKGGQEDRSVQINQAYQRLREYFLRP